MNYDSNSAVNDAGTFWPEILNVLWIVDVAELDAKLMGWEGFNQIAWLYDKSDKQTECQDEPLKLMKILTIVLERVLTNINHISCKPKSCHQLFI